MSVDKVRVRISETESFNVFFKDGEPSEVERVTLVWSPGRNMVGKELATNVRLAVEEAMGRLKRQRLDEAWEAAAPRSRLASRSPLRR